MDACSEIVDAIMRHMPKHAHKWLSGGDSSGYVLSIDWKLNNDSDRPNKRSKTIVIFIDRELLEDLPNYPSPMQRSAIKKIEAFIEEKVRNFDPNHSVPRYYQSPREEWSIRVDGLFG